MDNDATELEDEMYDLLQRALTRAECAARAVARVEYDIVQKHMEQQEPPTVDPDEVDVQETSGAQQASREFNSAHFQKTFSSLNVLRVVEDLITLFKLEHLEEDIATTLVNEMFRSKSGAAPSRSGEGETFIGSDADMLYHNLRRVAERKERGRR